MTAVKRFLLSNKKIRQFAKKILPQKLHEFLKQHFLFKPVKKRKVFQYDNNLTQGVNIIGIVRSGKSIGAQARLIAKALEAAGIPYCMIDLCDYFNCSKNNLEFEHKISNQQIYNVNLIVLNADCIHRTLVMLNRNEMNKRYNIGYWAWELAEFPDIWIPGFNCLQEVWTFSKFCANSIAEKSPVPVLSIPLFADNSNANINNGRGYFNLPQDVFLFMVAYDCDSFAERKNPQAAVKAFMNAFPPEDQRVGLILKIFSPENYQSHINELLKKLSEYKNIYYFDKYLSDEEMKTLISASDTFISLHRAEGFGLIPLEAMALGTPVVSTAWSGNMEYMNNNNAALTGYTMVPVNGQYLGTTPGEDYVWAEPDIEEASGLMKRLVLDKEWREKLIKNGKDTATNNFNADIMGNRIRKRLKTLSLLN